VANKRLNATITIGGAITGSLRSAFTSASKSLTQLGQETRRLSNEQKTLSRGIDTFGRMGKNVDGLREKYARVTEQLNKMRAATERLKRVEDARQANMAKRAELRGQMMDTVALGMMAGAPLKAAIDFESAMADVRKVVDFDEPDGLQKMSRTILDMSNRLPMAANDIAAIVAAGGQSGLAAGELTLFAESAVKMGVAFGITAGEAGQMMAEMRAAFGMNQEQVNILADKMNLLANTTAASESKIASVVSRVGPLGEVAGLAAGEVAALGATLVGIGVDENVAATGIQNFMLALVQGEAATKAQRTALKALGLDAKKVAKGMQTDAQGTIMSVLNAVKQLPAERQAAILTQLFGKESIKAIAPLLNVTEQLEENLKKVNDETLYAGAVAKEYAARAATTENNLQLFRNRVAGLGITIGSVLLPAMNSLLGTVGPMVTSVAQMAEKYPMATKVIVGTATALVGLKIAALAGGYAFTFVRGAALTTMSVLARMSAGVTMATAKFGGVGPIVRQVAFALVRTPWGAAVAGLIGAGVLVYREWERVKSFFTGLWQGVTEGLEPVRQKFASLAESVPGLKAAWDTVGSAVSSVIDWFGRLFQPVNHTSEQLQAAGKAGQTMGQWIATGIEWALKPTMLLIDAIQWISKNIGGVISSVKGMADAGTDMVKGAWQGTKSFFGMGEDDPEGEKPQQPAGARKPTLWQSTKSFLGFGQNEPEDGQSNGNVPAGYTAPDNLPTPAMATQAAPTSNVYNDNSQNTIQVTQQPGESADALARRVAAELEQQRQVRERAALTDGAYAQ
jgi:TP901 family phage tail tape measure protein